MEIINNMDDSNLMLSDSSKDTEYNGIHFNSINIGNKHFYNCVFRNCVFDNVIMYGNFYDTVIFDNCTFNDCSLSYSEFINVKLMNVVINNSTMLNTLIKESQLKSVNFNTVSLTNSQFIDNVLYHILLDSCDINNTNWYKCNVNDMVTNNTDFSGINNISDTIFSKCNDFITITGIGVDLETINYCLKTDIVYLNDSKANLNKFKQQIKDFEDVYHEPFENLITYINNIKSIHNKYENTK